jgi:diguanylate cyclase (GGDEF)-like protein/PAS domain S-box-containing protein
MFKSWFSGIFGFFFSRASIAIVSFALILLLILLPFFRSQLLDMVENQGQTFANTTIAATASNLYTESYGDALEYVFKVLKDTNNILFVVITKVSGDEIVIQKVEWQQSKNKFHFDREKLTATGNKLTYVENNPISHVDCFIYHQAIMIGGVRWGNITVGMSETQYQNIITRYFLIVVLASFLLVFILLLIFYKSSKKIRLQLSHLSATAFQLQAGNLSARAPDNSMGEIGTISTSINEMATNLQIQTDRITQLAQIVEQTNDVFVLFDSTLHVKFVNNAVTELMGYTAVDFMGMAMLDFTTKLNLNYLDLLHELDLMSSAKQHIPVRDIVIITKSRMSVDVEMRLETIAINKDNELSFLMVLSNIATRKKLENELHQLAYYDKLTDLPNRRMFMDSLRNTIKSSERNKKSFALFFMDLDNFKYINDSLGHEAGDEFLVQVGNKLRDIFRSNDMVTRLGGDEFTVIIEDIKDSGYMDVAYLAEKLVTDLASKPIFINGRPLSISTSLGVAKFPENGSDSTTLLRNADTAMYAAKKSGKNRFAFFSEEMNLSLRYRIELERDLKQAIQLENQITLYYQPILDLITQNIVGVEALARWNHPEKGFIPPDEFIKIAESSNLIITLSEYLLNTAFKQAKVWQEAQFTPYVSVNISGREFEKPNFIDRLVTLLNDYDLSASKIQLEFTESIMLDSTKETIVKFEKLKKVGFKIAIDDFGTGYSSLGYIHQLPIDVIKIDKSFVIGMLENSKTNAIVTAITSLSTTLGIKTIAEGVELEVHAKRLRQYKCDYGQGYLYDKALPIVEFERKYRFSAQQIITLEMEQYIRQIIH